MLEVRLNVNDAVSLANSLARKLAVIGASMEARGMVLRSPILSEGGSSGIMERGRRKLGRGERGEGAVDGCGNFEGKLKLEILTTVYERQAVVGGKISPQSARANRKTPNKYVEGGLWLTVGVAVRKL